jgi:methyltransferase
VIWALGEQWNTRVIVVPGASRVTRGPYRWPWLRHPNYWIVAIEGIALPLVHSAWITAIAFTVLNAVLLLGFRIPTENRALAALREA